MQNQNDNFEKFRPLKIKIMETIHTFAEEFIAKINEQSDAELDGFMGLPWAPKLQETRYSSLLYGLVSPMQKT